MSKLGWRRTRLSRAVTIRGGRDFAAVADPDGEFPVFGSGGEFARASEYLYAGHGVVFGRKGTIDRPTPVHGKFWVTDTGYFVEPMSNILDSQFLSYWSLRFPFEYYSTDTALPSMTRSDIGSEPIDLPPLAIQQSIADYLDHETAEIDALMNDLRTLDALNRERRDAHLEQQVLASSDETTQLRRLSPNKESGTSVNGAPWPADPGTPGVLKTGAASQREYRPWENKAVLGDREIARLTAPVRSDRVLINRANTPKNVGAAAYIRESSPDLYLSDKLWSIDFDAENEYVALALRTQMYQDQASQLAVGTSSSMQNLPYEAFLTIRIPVPPISTQRAICRAASVVETSFQKSTQEVTRAIALAKERRAALITAAVTGQIDVTAKHRPAAEQLEDDIKELT